MWQCLRTPGCRRLSRFGPPALPVCTPRITFGARRRFLLRCMSARRSFQRRWLDRCSSGASVPRLKLRHPAQPRQSRRWPPPPTANCVNAAALGGGLVSIVLWWVGGGVGHPRKAIAAAVSVHSTCMPAAFGGHLGLGDRSRSVSLSGTP
ncbi:hypothetical transmembrane protein [Mycobacterium tuberculosis F11]|nr:hypothetical transmembrane protein [Mycobacterium tuberculosis F11]EFD77776.1 conserved hypothetical protein [Mycobacterium tuberculosis T85]